MEFASDTIDQDNDEENDDENEANEKTASGPALLDIYLFVWNRARMIAKDFILQNYRFGGNVDHFAIMCHEHMARWQIMMNHQLADSGRDGGIGHSHGIYICGRVSICNYFQHLFYCFYLFLLLLSSR